MQVNDNEGTTEDQQSFSFAVEAQVSASTSLGYNVTRQRGSNHSGSTKIHHLTAYLES